MPAETAHLNAGQLEAELLKLKSDDSGRARRRLANRIRNPKNRSIQKTPANGFG